MVKDSNQYLGVISNFLGELNLADVTPSAQQVNVDTWLSWYKGNVQNFHTYKIYNGNKEIKISRKSMQMAKSACEDWADLLLNEKVKIMVGEESKQEILDKVLLKNNFYVKGNQLIEKAFALGDGAFVEFNTGNKDNPVEINYCNAKMIYPLRISNGEVIDCAFCWMIDEDVYYATVHTRNDDGSYHVLNRIFYEGKNNEIKYYGLPEGVLDEYDSETRLFQIVMPNSANNIDIDCDRGISVFANSIDILKDIDLKFDGYDTEFSLGRKRAFVNSSVSKFNTDDKGNITPTFDPEDIVFYSMDMSENEKSIEFVDPQLRVEQFDRALQTSLNLYGDSVGFGTNHYTFKDGVTYTNQTQIISSNSKMYRRLKKHELVLEKSLIDLANAILYLVTNTINEADVSIDFDDSIIEDTAEKQRQALLEYNAQLIDATQYFMQTRNMDEATAKAFVKSITDRQPSTEEELDPEEDDEARVIKKGNKETKNTGE